MKRYTTGLITGILLTASVMMFIGAKSQTKIITVETISVVYKGKMVAALTGSKSGGVLGLYNNNEQLVALMGTDDGGGGVVDLYNSRGDGVVRTGSNQNDDGYINLLDRYGDIGWSQNGRR